MEIGRRISQLLASHFDERAAAQFHPNNTLALVVVEENTPNLATRTYLSSTRAGSSSWIERNNIWIYVVNNMARLPQILHIILGKFNPLQIFVFVIISLDFSTVFIHLLRCGGGTTIQTRAHEVLPWMRRQEKRRGKEGLEASWKEGLWLTMWDAGLDYIYTRYIQSQGTIDGFDAAVLWFRSSKYSLYNNKTIN